MENEQTKEFTPEANFKVIDRKKGRVDYIGIGGSVVVPPMVAGCVVRWLECQGCEVTALDTSSTPELWYLDCSLNNLTILDLTHNPALRVLDCRNNANLTTLDLSNNPILLSDGELNAGSWCAGAGKIISIKWAGKPAQGDYEKFYKED